MWQTLAGEETETTVAEGRVRETGSQTEVLLKMAETGFHQMLINRK